MKNKLHILKLKNYVILSVFGLVRIVFRREIFFTFFGFLTFAVFVYVVISMSCRK